MKIAQSLAIAEDAVREGLAVLGEAVDEAVAVSKRPAKRAHTKPAAKGVGTT